MIKVCKFGGTSMSDGTNFRRVAEIVEADRSRRFVVVSAPGKRFGGDSKVTDMLYASHELIDAPVKFSAAFGKVRARFQSIADELGFHALSQQMLDETEEQIIRLHDLDFTVSRGEYLAGRLMAALLDVPFLDAKDVIYFTSDGRLDEERTYATLTNVLKDKKRAVVPGFYGAMPDGSIKTFSRGGSDVSGAIVARAAGADVYENWTDVSGFMACDPHIAENPVQIPCLSYQELRELSYMGANVLHSESVFPVREADIPIRIKNTFRPDEAGTEVLPLSQYRFTGRTVTGIAGKRNFTVIYLEKSLMNAEIGFGYRVLGILNKYGVSFEHIPSGIDTMSLVIEDSELKGVLEKICEDIQNEVHPDHLRVWDKIAIIAVVGHGMSKNIGTSARLFRAIARAGVNVRMIDQGSSELNIIVGVDDKDYERTVKAVYREFFEENEESPLSD